MTLSQRSPQVVLTEGTVIGSVEKLPNGSFYYVYRDIPFAEPPVGKLRFEDPIPLTKFPENILDCKKERDVSIHKDFITSNLIGSEDCLHLNVYSPVSPDDVANADKLAVLVFIHGGAFAFGSSNSEYYSPEYLVQENVVVVTLNYRLRVLGFLCLPEAGISGNAGLKDQLVALKWVHKSISNFGGDVNNVTLFGGSSGGAAVGLHMLSEKSRKYFHKAICQGGTSLDEWLIQPDPIGKSKKLAELLGFKGGSQVETLDYLRNVKDLSGFQKHLLTVSSADERRRNLSICFKPCVEQETVDAKDSISLKYFEKRNLSLQSKAFISKLPIELMNQPNFINIPVMIGYNSAEGIGVLSSKYESLHVYERDLSRIIPRSLSESPTEWESQKLAAEIRKFYFDGQPITEKLLNEMVKLQGDYHFAISSNLFAEIHFRKQPNSKHVKADRSEMSTSTRVAKKMCRMWTNFAKYGSPTPANDKSLSIKWDPVKPTKDGEKFILEYLEIDDEFWMRTDPDKDRIEFWRKLYQKWNGSFIRPKL
ncbi:esterase E4-like [Bradysia coprophila]|uniref:esterase E4-like n=1 Tax=Bradysia coprophila TaxID=38358 RepID=UPI00187D9F28|nr:esterase E4-like [Bradysia coprophila]